MYYGDPDPLVSTGWISDVEGYFRTTECPPNKKTRLATSLLRGNVKNWLDGKIDIVGEEPFMRLSWDDFKKEFFEEFRTQADFSRMRDELRSLRQGSTDLNTLKATFLSKTRFCPEYSNNNRMLMEDFLNTLNDDFRGKISIGKVDSFAKLFAVAKGFESYTPTMAGDTSGERRGNLYSAPRKKARSAIDGTSSGRKGVSDTSVSRCFNCGERGHECWECPVSRSSGIVCFNCHKGGHCKEECPKLAVAGVARRRSALAKLYSPLEIIMASGRLTFAAFEGTRVAKLARVRPIGHWRR
ncbi:uncharacterized protein [Rutidosis leptorrhynchoides]|uniref:uncharacterized protein n=1 Tax=Rutidosis leptorrhynchoides TaxID=125765 RepID=UPI003A996DC8